MTTKPAGLPEVINNIEKLMKDHELILSKLEKVIKQDDLNNVAAKIINDLSKKIEKCECNKEILERIDSTKGVLIPQPEITKEKVQLQPFSGKYSFPNYAVGNEELGESKEGNALRIPPLK